MAQPFIGQIIACGFSYAPPGWFLCDGTLYPISQYDVLFALIGTTYGGNGQTTFAVPDLRGRTPLSMGQGQGLSNYVQGQLSGTENVSLQSGQLGIHNHNLMSLGTTGTSNTPSSTMALAANSLIQVPTYLPGSPAPALTPLVGNAIGPNGSSFPHQNLQPLQCLNYIIAWTGIYPAQS
jgi:microcystin-dependent protein